MWIKKIGKSLYISILIRMIVAAIISVLVFSTLVLISEAIYESRVKGVTEQEKQEILRIAEEIKEEIAEEEMTFAEAEQVEWSERYNKLILVANEHNIDYFYDNETEIIDDIEIRDIYQNADIIGVEFSDVSGYLVINFISGSEESNIHYIIAAIVGAVVFFVLSIRLFLPIVAYVKTIGDGVNMIASENMKHKIPIVGTNELSELAVKINHMGDVIHENIRRERQVEQGQRMLITNISHDLRTPLTAIIGFMDLAKSSLSKSDKAYGYVEVAKNNSVRLEKLINDLFTYSKLISEDMNYNMTRVDINLILSQILELKKCPYEYYSPKEKLYINVDIDKFQRMIDNLVNNAEKYRNEESKILVKTEHTKENVSIIIENTTDDDLDDKIHLLKNRLYTAREDRNNTSTGLGLSIVHEFAKAMDGKFQIEYDKPLFKVKLTFKRN